MSVKMDGIKLLKASGVSLKVIADHAGMSNTTIQTLLKGGENPAHLV